MSKKIPYYIVVMMRWGDPADHSYIIGLTKDPLTARIMGKSHSYYRGQKYDPKIIPIDLQEQSKYFIVEQYNGEKHNLVITVCYDEEGVSEVKEKKRARDFFEVSPWTPVEMISEDDMLECHHYLDAYTTEEQAYLREMYESYIRHKLNIL